MKTFLCGLAVLPLLTAGAMAQPLQQPMQLSDNQMDSVSAGFTLRETDVSNTSWTVVSIYSGPVTCSSCYLNITSTPFSLASNFGPVPTL